ncbi:hypothetical protein K501DRAFT_305251 [Backusella circina FSU 941]|nr:hypothetical protein K501DRAFT_305251 [Backusella circina FSU 941]
MSGIKDYDSMLEDTPYTIPYDLHKDISIPILRDDYTVSEDCKEIGKQLLQNTKRPLCQNLDVIIPERERSGLSKRDVESFKNFIGQRMFKEDEHMTDIKSNGYKTPMLDTKKETIIPQTASSDALNKMKELITTEETYVKHLQAIVQHIIKPIRKTLKDKAPLLDQFTFNNIFLNIESICEVNTAFYEELRKYNDPESLPTEESLGSVCKRFVNVLEMKLFNGTLNDLLGPIVQRITRYDLMFDGPQHPDVPNFRDALAKVVDICTMNYGPNAKGSELIYFFTLIKNSPCRFLNDKRKLLGYFDCTEMSMSSGRNHRAVTLLVFTDKLMVVKRKNYELSSRECFEKFKQKINNETSPNPLKKIVDLCSGTSLEFKGWVDIKATEVFDGLKDRPDTFLLRTSLPELADDDIEAEYEDYFRRSDRLFSVIPNKSGYHADKTEEYKDQRNNLISLYQHQFALLNFTDENEVFHESNFALPAYAYIYNEKSYAKSNLKNNILAVYVEDDYRIDLESLLTEDVWALVLIQKEAKGFKGVVRSKVSMTPLREPREMEYETIVDSNQNINGKYDFFTTLWNSVIYYERRLRASNYYADIHDSRLRERARSRSRSKSITRATSLFFRSRSRSTSPSRSLDTFHKDENSTISTTTTLKSSMDSTNNLYHDNVVDPILNVASVNKPLLTDDILMQDSKQDTISSYENAMAQLNMDGDDHFYPSRGASVPAYSPYDRRDSFEFNSIDKSAGCFIDRFNDRRRPEESIYGGSNVHQDNSRQNSYSNRNNFYNNSYSRPSMINTTNRQPSYDMTDYYHHPLEPVSRPHSGSGNSSSSATSDSPTSVSTNNEMAAMCGNINHFSSFRGNSMHDDYFEGSNYSNDRVNEENLFQSLEKVASFQSFSSKRGSMAPPPNRENMRPGLPSQYSRKMVVDQLTQLKHEFNSTIDNLINQSQMSSHQGYNITPEDVRGLRSNFMSRLDDLSNGANPSLRYRSYR